MIENIQVEYKGFSIRYNEFMNKWENTETDRTYESLAKAKEAVDRIVRTTEKMEPIPCIRFSSYDGYKEMQIMAFESVDCIWIREPNGKGRGQKTSISNYDSKLLLENTPENKAVIEKIDELSKQCNAIEKQIKRTEDNLVPLNIKAHYKKLFEKGVLA
jgi:hypothetical protein